MAKNNAHQKKTGEIGGWSFEITTTFVQVPDEKRELYQAAIRWMAEQMIKQMRQEMEAKREDQTKNEETRCT